MTKHLKDILLSGYCILFIFVVVVFLTSWLYMSYTRPIDIQYRYSGIKYQAGNLKGSEPIGIEIKGKYERRWFGKPELFEGQIIIDGKALYGVNGDGSGSNKYAFNNKKMGSIQGDGFKGSIYNKDNMKEILIEIHEIDSKGSESFNYKNGWLISAPCSSRKEAVEISNMMIQKSHKDVVIK